jgi:peptide/nickel transport system permease protein
VKWQFIAVKLLRALVTLWLIVTFAFVILRLSGDPTEAILGDETDADAIAYYQKKYGLDRPLHEQYIGYFVDVLKMPSRS